MNSATVLVPLGDLVKPSRPRVKPADHPDLPFLGMEHIEAHSMKVLGSVPAAQMKSASVRFHPGDVLYGRLRPYLNKVARPAFHGLCSAEFIVLPENERIDGKYLQYFLNSASFVKFATHLNAGDRPRVDFEQIAQYEIPLRPIEHQRRIVAEIEKQFSRLDEAVANLRRVKANLKRYVSSVLSNALAEVSNSGNTRTWRTVAVLDVGEVLLGRRRAPEYVKSAHACGYLRVANIKDDFIDFDDLESMQFDDHHLARYELRTGDVLVSEGQSPEKLGQSAIFRGHPERLCFQSTLHRFRADPGKTSPEFAQIIFRSHVRSGVFRKLGSITTNIGHLTLEKFKAAPFPLPPLAEQDRIVAEVDRRLSIVRGVEAEVDANLKRAQALRQAVLQRAFSDRPAVNVRTTAARPSLRLIPGTGSAIETARVALSAEIVHRLHTEPHFGRVKHQKIVHLCEYIAKLEHVQGQYVRAAAGPLDLPMIEANERVMKTLGWYAEQPRAGGLGHEYSALSKAGEHKPYLACFSDEQLQSVRKLIDLMRDWKTDRCEMFSTVYAAWNDLLLFGNEPTPDAIVSEILERWNDAKLKFTRQQWLSQIEWVRKQGFEPKGFGRSTRGQTDGLTPDLFQNKSR